MFIQMEYCTGKNDAIALYIAVKKWSSNILMQNNSQRQSMSGTAQVYDIAYDIYMLTCSGGTWKDASPVTNRSLLWIVTF